DFHAFDRLAVIVRDDPSEHRSLLHVIREFTGNLRERGVVLWPPDGEERRITIFACPESHVFYRFWQLDGNGAVRPRNIIVILDHPVLVPFGIRIPVRHIREQLRPGDCFTVWSKHANQHAPCCRQLFWLLFFAFSCWLRSRSRGGRGLGL